MGEMAAAVNGNSCTVCAEWTLGSSANALERAMWHYDEIQ